MELINYTHNILDSEEENITNIKAINHDLIINTLERTHNTSATYYWNAINNKWGLMADVSFPFVQKESRLYAVGMADAMSPGNINYVNIKYSLPDINTLWQTLVVSTVILDCVGDLHIINNHYR